MKSSQPNFDPQKAFSLMPCLGYQCETAPPPIPDGGVFLLPCINSDSEFPLIQNQLPGSLHFIRHGINLYFLHEGIDFSCTKKSERAIWRACAEGKVFFVAQKSEFLYGKHLYINHLDGRTCSLYSHFNEIFVREGDCVAEGQALGEPGATWFGFNHPGQEHLHFELRSGQFTSKDCPKDGTLSFGLWPAELVHQCEDDLQEWLCFLKKYFRI